MRNQQGSKRRWSNVSRSRHFPPLQNVTQRLRLHGDDACYGVEPSKVQQGERLRNQIRTLQVPVHAVSFLVRQRAHQYHWGPCNLHCICMMHVGSCHASNKCHESMRVDRRCRNSIFDILFPRQHWLGLFIFFGFLSLSVHHVSSKELTSPKTGPDANRNLRRRLSAMPSCFTNGYATRSCQVVVFFESETKAVKGRNDRPCSVK